MHFEPAQSSVEHYVTLFDSNFLPIGLCLHHSLSQHASPFHLWVVCMDDLVHQQLNQLALPYLTAIGLADVENSALRSVKPTRSKGEYCWTITPFTPELVFSLAPDATRVTYLDADLFFFNSPASFFKEFEQSGKHVLITEHAYAPEYAFRAETSGRFCVQFMTFLRTDKSFEVMHWWQERCIEWCFAHFESGKFGDQKYLDVWPELFADKVHVLTQTADTLAPWNIQHMLEHKNASLKPVIYHFHALRIVSSNKIKLFESYTVGKKALVLYKEYLNVLRAKVAFMSMQGMPMPILPEHKDSLMWLRHLRSWMIGTRSLEKLFP